MKEKKYYEELGYDLDPPFYASTSIPIVTNYDRLVSKTPEEMAEYLYVKTCVDAFPQFISINGWLDWLKQEATDVPKT